MLSQVHYIAFHMHCLVSLVECGMYSPLVFHNNTVAYIATAAQIKLENLEINRKVYRSSKISTKSRRVSPQPVCLWRSPVSFPLLIVQDVCR